MKIDIGIEIEMEIDDTHKDVGGSTVGIRQACAVACVTSVAHSI